MVIDLAHCTLAAFNIVLLVMYFMERRRAAKQETLLIKAVLSETPQEFNQALETSKDRIKEMTAESKLAEKAYKLQEAASPEPINWPIG